MKLKWMAVAILVIALVAGGAWVFWVKFEGEKPTLQLLPDKQYIGRSLSVKVEDRKSGVSELRVEVGQQGKSVTLLDEKFPKETHSVERTLALKPLPQGLKDGEAQIKIAAKDHSWNWGNPAALEKKIIIDTTPPQLAVLGAQHYANRGGAGLITYQISEEAPVNGIQVGDLFFRGYIAIRDRHLAYFAIPIDAPSGLSTQAIAEDHAGNRTQSSIRLMIKPKAFKRDKIYLTDQFLNNILPYFTSRDPSLKGSPLEVFLAVNQKQREIDHKEIKKICQLTAPQPLWSGPFLRLPNSKPMASFAQDRTYYFNGREVDRQIHWGIDLASVNQAPIPAANSGKVAFAGPLGIYGNTVLIDHGCGLFSMYAHLSRIETEVKKEVKKGEILGRTGATGLAGGDHLHFAMVVNGLFVNPIEWWDEHWIRDNIELKMKWLEGPSQPEPVRKVTKEAGRKGKTKKPSRRTGRP